MKLRIFSDKLHTKFPGCCRTLVYPVLLILLVLADIRLILPKEALFGSEGDWLSQHAAIAGQLRSIFQETKELLPACSALGAGSNIYDLSYYGFLRPDVLVSYLLPKIPMTYIISRYAILELLGGTVVCYFWLKRHTAPFFAFLGALLFSCTSCFYHAHHQIMFVNYMPFLILALWGIEKLLEKGSFWLLTLSLFLVCMHSYYFVPAVLVVCMAYFLHCLCLKKKLSFCSSPVIFALGYSPKVALSGFCLSIGLSLGMAAILLLPTGLDLLSTTKDAGTPAALTEIFSLQPDLTSLLYHPYGCGLTLLCLYTLALSIRRKSTRGLGIFLLLCLTVNTCSYVLSGFLYVRYKVLIPLIPLLLLLCVRTLEALFTQQERHSLPLGLLCLLPAVFSEYSAGILADGLWIFFTFFLIRLGQYRISRQNVKVCQAQTFSDNAKVCQAQTFSDNAKVCQAQTFSRLLLLLLCLPPFCLSILLGRQEKFISASDSRQWTASQGLSELSDCLDQNNNYRFECLTEPFVNVNTQAVPGLGRTAMYSSVTDSSYADFFYNTMRNPIRIRNRVALMTDANPFFSYLMGIRYIQADAATLPWGFSPIAAGETDSASDSKPDTGQASGSKPDTGQASNAKTVIAENPRVLPIAYTSTAQMEQAEFSKLSFPYTLEALTRYTVVPQNALDAAPSVTAEEFMQNTRITPVSPKDFITEPLLQTLHSRTLEKETRLTIPVPQNLQGKLFILSVGVNSPKGDEVTIDINGIRNRLSGKDAPYPNHNDTFTWILSSNDSIARLEILLSPGTYTLSGWQMWRMDVTDWGNSSVLPLENSGKHTQLPQGRAVLKSSGFLVTSLPYRKGYKVWVNGKKADIVRVNQTFVGIPLEAGDYEISISYSPPGRKAACLISLLSLLLLISLAVFRRLHRPGFLYHTTEKRF